MRGSKKSVTVGLPHWPLKLEVDSSRFMGHWEDPELPEMARKGHSGSPGRARCVSHGAGDASARGPLCTPLLTQRDFRLPTFHCAHLPSRVH